MQMREDQVSGTQDEPEGGSHGAPVQDRDESGEKRIRDTSDQPIEAQSCLEKAPELAPSGFDPLGTCPERMRRRYARRSTLAHRHPTKAIELSCTACCGWSRPEAARCEIRSCPLWAINRRIFGS
jgi:hypothetical protein